MSGPVVHFEIPADDVGRAQQFYREAFGWQINSMPDMGYSLLQTTPSSEEGRPTEVGAINGGMLERQSPVTSPVIVLAVEDIDKTLETIGSLGGTTLQGKQAVGDMGFAAYFADSEGNVMGLWQNAG